MDVEDIKIRGYGNPLTLQNALFFDLKKIEDEEERLQEKKRVLIRCIAYLREKENLD